ncbi:hypothetical protein V6141_22865, partial [Klebsiella pneumoniae]
MKFVKIMIIASAFYLTYAHAREIHQAVDEPAAPYNLRWGMSYDEARNTPLYSLEVSDINYAGKDPDLIISTLAPQEVGNDSNLLIVFYVQIMPDDLVMQLHR